MDTKHLYMAIEKDAGIASGIAKGIRGFMGFARKPVRTTLKKIFWSRAPKGKIIQNVGEELSYAKNWGAGLAAGGVAASPFFVRNPINA